MIKNLLLSIAMSTTCGLGVINSSHIRSINYPSGSNDGLLWYGDFGVNNIGADANTFHTDLVLRDGEVSLEGNNSSTLSTNAVLDTGITKFYYTENSKVYTNCLYINRMDDNEYQESISVIGNAHYVTSNNQVYKRVFIKPYFRTNFLYEESEVSHLDTRYLYLKIKVVYPLSSIPFNSRGIDCYSGLPTYSTSSVTATSYPITNDYSSCELSGTSGFTGTQDGFMYTFNIPVVKVSSQGLDNLQESFMNGWSHSYGIDFLLSNNTTSAKPSSISYWFQWLDEEEYATGYDEGYAAGRTQGYNEGLIAGQENNPQWLNLFGAVADTPILMLRSMFNFDLFGMNVLAVVLSLLTGVMIFVIVRKFMAKK